MSVHIDEPSFVHPSAKIGTGVSIGRFSHIGPNVTIQDNVKIFPHVYIDGCTTIGENCTIYPFASLGAACQDLKFKGERTFVTIGPSTTIRECVTVNSSTGEEQSTAIGENCLIMAYSHVAHNCSVGNRVIMANSATLAGHVALEDFVSIGGLTAVHQFCRIGEYTFVGGCSKVTQDLPPYMLADGHPAKVHALNVIGLKRHGFSDADRKGLKQAFRILFRSGLSLKHALEKMEKEIVLSPVIRKFLDFVKASERGISR